MRGGNTWRHKIENRLLLVKRGPHSPAHDVARLEYFAADLLADPPLADVVDAHFEQVAELAELAHTRKPRPEQIPPQKSTHIGPQGPGYSPGARHF